MKALVEEKLVDYVAVDAKNGPTRYGETVGVPGFKLEKIQEHLDYYLVLNIP